MSADSVEIERKFLVQDLPDLSDAQCAVIRQGYLTVASDSVEMRLRDKNGACFLTLKSDGGVARVERETALSQDQFDTFWPQTIGRRVEKRRWSGALPDGLTFELDLFDGDLEGLRLVEVEFPSESAAEAFAPPSWFGADVTQDKRFKNKALAMDGVPVG